MLVFVLLGLLSGALIADARYVEKMEHGFVIPCEGEMCMQTLFCWKGARFADLNQLGSKVTAEVKFHDKQDTCIEVESDDKLSPRFILFGHDEPAEVRLSNRMGQEKSWVTSIREMIAGDNKGSSDAVECMGTICTVKMSPYLQSCIRLCSKPVRDRTIKAEVTFRSENAFDAQTLYFWAIGFAIVASANALSRRPEMFYIFGGTLGVTCAVALLVLVISRLTTQSGPTKAQLGIAATFQIGAVYMRNTVEKFILAYLDWIVIYVLVTFSASIAFIHYWLKGDDGRIRISSSLNDIMRTMLQLLGAFVITARVPSAWYRIVITIVIFAGEIFASLHHDGYLSLLSMSKQSHKKPREVDEYTEEEVFYEPELESKHVTQTPQRAQAYSATRQPRYSAATPMSREQYKKQGEEYTAMQIEKLLTPKTPVSEMEMGLLDWLKTNHKNVFVRKEPGSHAESESDGENSDSDDGEGEGSD